MNLKNLYYILLLVSLPILLNAQEGNCVVFSTDGATFHIALDNKFQNKDANTNIKVTDIPEGDYWVTVFFTDKTRKAFKSNVRILGKKETSFQIEKDDNSWKLKQYSSVPLAQVQSVSNKQTVLAYNDAGVSIQGMKSANDISKDMVERDPEINRVHGTLEEEAESKRSGKFSGSSADIEGETEVAAATPAPQAEEKEGTTIINKYITTTNADGTTSIVEETTTLIKEIVERNGQRQMRTKRSVALTPTDLTCLPMEKDAFLALKDKVQNAAADQRLNIAQDGIKGQCMTPKQIKAVGDLILSEVDQNNFAIAAKEVCANPKKFPYTISDPVVVKEPKAEPQKEVKEVKEVIKEEPVVVEEPTKEKTKAELKAELKALKEKQKAEKAAAKAKKKAEKAAAKAKKKAEKEAAKAKKKAEKEAAKAKKK
ncbi:hypothetical protein [Aureispira sp. CCB-QB1]|uniref:hypothetical protein n=1 Tax=Aureispira sp. CCB-QB1 TaxID=1313421 RepID=UPI000696CC7A|nr:hypothetical protein [Aureispira sp. CCB-QB1]